MVNKLLSRFAYFFISCVFVVAVLRTFPAVPAALGLTGPVIITGTGNNSAVLENYLSGLNK